MPVLKDISCTACGSRSEMLLDGASSSFSLHCPICKAMTIHASICNGGMNSRYVFNDITPERVRERHRITRVEAYTVDADGNEVPAKDFNTGRDLTEASGINDPDGRAERKDRVYWKDRHRRGRTPIVLDMKRRRERQSRRSNGID